MNYNVKTYLEKPLIRGIQDKEERTSKYYNFSLKAPGHLLNFAL